MGRLEDLQELRELLTESLREAPASGRAPLSAELRKTLAEIDALMGAGEPERVTVFDEIAARRAVRFTGS